MPPALEYGRKLGLAVYRDAEPFLRWDGTAYSLDRLCRSLLSDLQRIDPSFTARLAGGETSLGSEYFPRRDGRMGEHSGQTVAGAGDLSHAQDRSDDKSNWITVTAAAKESGASPGRVSAACTARKILCVGVRRARLICPTSLDHWMVARKGRATIKATYGQLKDKAASSFGLCRNCAETVTLTDGSGICPKCRCTKMDPLPVRRPVEQLRPRKRAARKE